MRRLQLLRVIRLGILAVGFLSAFAWWLDPTQLLGEPKLYYRRAFTGTFINANTAATYFGFGALLWTARALESGVMAAPRRMSGWQGRVLQITDALTPHAMGAPMAAIACVAMVAMTGSRAGLLITLALAVAMVMAAMNMRQRRGFLYAALAAAGVIGVLVVPSTLFDRLLAGGLWDNYRFEVYRICLVMLKDAPWIGHGAGAFEFIFPAYRTETLGMFGIWDHAHSTPLELAVDMGLPFVMLLALVWGAALARLGGAVWQHRIVHAPAGGAAIAGLAVAVLGTLHSLIDFPLQLAGTLIPFAAIVAMALAATDAAVQQSAIRLPQSNESSARQMTKDY